MKVARIGIDLAAKTVIKSHFSGKTLATIKFNSEPYLCGLRPNAIEVQAAPCQAEVISYQAAVQDTGKLVIKEVKQSQSKAVDLTEANIIITGGRPMASEDNYKILQECADLMGAAVGASRAAVDAGYAPHSMQVGQTGKTVSPKLYLALGISGAAQHLVGTQNFPLDFINRNMSRQQLAPLADSYRIIVFDQILVCCYTKRISRRKADGFNFLCKNN